eukprot:NODE_2738_length_477_cov_170.490654_g2157_i0.p2 GENE.NODE_2738_length_477_cov_170.490654_g2157_i0~~NODE_2738_length_477_cov_170.490654_g2157_i0.p2  ORF type:complete len:107 (+),score=34.36 NODE_2738_length_477_cov_170.490654_g2157_i0:33-353(+)
MGISIAVTRALGDIIFKDDDMTGGKPSGLIAEPALHTVTLTKDDSFLVIGCDGLWDVMEHDEALQFVRELLQSDTCTPQSASEMLAAEAMKRGSTDNITVLVVTLF